MASLDTAFDTLLNPQPKIIKMTEKPKKISLFAINDMGHLEFTNGKEQFRMPTELFNMVYNDINKGYKKYNNGICRVVFSVKNNVTSKIYNYNDVLYDINFTQLS
jgi:hypothetical protein